MLKVALESPVDAQSFIESIANIPDKYPLGIHPETADWLRWSAQKEKFEDKISNNEHYFFPFDRRPNWLLIKMHEEDAVTVLQVLSRYFILTKLMVRQSSGEYGLLSELVSKDTLIFFSRYPQFIPLFPMFQYGHFEIEKEITKIGSEDIYFLAKNKMRSSTLQNGKAYELMFNVMVGDYTEFTGQFSIEFYDYEFTNRDGSRQLFESTAKELNALVAKKAKEFTALLGLPLPEFKIVEEAGIDDTYHNFIFKTKKGRNINQNLYAAFLMFIALDK